MKENNILNKYDFICNYFGMTANEKPLVLHGENAVAFYKNHLENKGFASKKINKMIKSANGIFLYENIDYNYINNNLSVYINKNNFDKNCFENGIVCLFKMSESSLTHELRHAYQLNNSYMKRYMMLDRNAQLKYLYETLYIYYPSEQDAFYHTLMYLKHRNMKLTMFTYAVKIAILEIEYYFKTKFEYKLSSGITAKTAVKPLINLIKSLPNRLAIFVKR